MLKLQTEIATAVADALKATLLDDFSAKIELGGTHNAAAFDAYLRASSSQGLGAAFFGARRYQEAVAAYTESISVDPNYQPGYGYLGLAFYAAGHLGSALATCEVHRNNYQSQVCLAMVHDKLGRHADAQAELTKIETAYGDAAAYQHAQIHAQWGDRGKALEWLAAAMRVRDSGLIALRADPLLDPLRQEPRFQEIERELQFSP